ncbi:phage tail fiber /phage host specificity protein J [Escherichia coli DEC4C]|nr:phage tail fiber /phage host specificity protein J [Escherichia coli DEC4C]
MGKGSSKGHTPREAKDNLKSTQLLSVIDAISEGPVEGPVDGLKSVLLNSTPVLDSEGNTNISGVTVVFRAGEQEQTPPEGFESSGSETVLGTEVKYDTPITRTITSANIDRLRLLSACRHWWKPPQRGTGIHRKSACWFRYNVTVAG